MKGFLLLTWLLLKGWMRSRSGLFFSFLFPVMLLLIFGAVFGGSPSSPPHIYVQNQDTLPGGAPTPLSAKFVELINGTAFGLTPIGPSEDPASFIASQGAVFTPARVLVIPRGFQEGLLNLSLASRLDVMISFLNDLLSNPQVQLNASQRGQIAIALGQLERLRSSLSPRPVNLTLYSMAGDTLAPQIQGELNAYASAFGQGLLGLREPLLQVSQQQVGVTRLRATDFYVPGLLSAFILTNGAIGVTNVVSEQRRRGVLKRLMASPMGKATWFLANVAQQVIVAYALLALMLVSAMLAFGFSELPDVYTLLLITLGAAAFCGLGVLLGASFRDVEAAAAVGNAIAFPMMFLSGAMIPVELFPPFIQRVATYLPLYYFTSGLRETLVLGQPQNALPDFLFMAIFALVLMLLGVKSVRWRE
jgi:ABC-2 type transport system permease protein